MRPHFFLILLSSLLFFSCKSAKELYNEGKYDKVLDSLEKKAAEGKLNREEKSLFIKSFNAWTEEENKKLEQLYSSNEHKNWEKGLKSLNKINDRQSKVKRYGRIDQDKLIYINTDEWKTDFDTILCDYRFDNYEDRFNRYDNNGDKNEVIKAYKEVQKMKEYCKDWRLIDSLEQLCLELGHRNFEVRIDNNSFGVFFQFNRYFEDQIDLFDDKWSSYSTSFPDSLTDYYIRISLERVYDSERSSEFTREYTDRVIDRYETQTDTAGNTTQVPIYVDISARVNEVETEYSIDANAEASIYRAFDNRRVFYETYTEREVERLERNFFVSGDRSAIPSSVRLERNNTFNYDFDDLIEQALEDLADEISRDLNGF